jgi:DNA-binding CsgD family transcriptional regulator
MVDDHLWIGAAQLDVVASPDAVSRHIEAEPPESTVGCYMTPSRAAETPGLSAEAFATLTPAEMEVVLSMSRGLTDPDEVADSLCRSPHTIRKHLANIYSKLNVHSRDEILACLLKQGSAPPTNGTAAGSTSKPANGHSRYRSTL